MAYINAYCNAGDELVTFEPMFPLYLDHVEMAGAKTIGVGLYYEDGGWKYSLDKLREALGRPKVKIFLFNTPHNPTGKVFTQAEMEEISAVLDEFPHILILTDEVYEMLAFDGREHLQLATVGNNWDRTVSIFSGGKLLNATGWKIGWTIGPQRLIHLGGVIGNTVYYCFNTPGQVAIGASLDHADAPGYNAETGKSYKEDLKDLFVHTRDYMTRELKASGLPLEVLNCEGGYFLMCDISKFRDHVPKKYLDSHDYEDDANPVLKFKITMPDGRVPLDLAFCRWMAMEKGVVMMPNSFFYVQGSANMTENFARMAICKTIESTTTCIERIKSIKLD